MSARKSQGDSGAGAHVEHLDPASTDHSETHPHGAASSAGERKCQTAFAAQADIVQGREKYREAAEAIAKVRARLTHGTSQRYGVLLVTSAVPGDGKSFMALNLALSLAGPTPDQPTLLIDADLRRPGIAHRLDPAPENGLAQILQGEASFEASVARIKGTHLDVLTSLRTAHEPSTLLSSERTRNLITVLRSRYARIVIDTPPLLLFADADVMASLSDGVLLVARSMQTPKNALSEAIERLSERPLLGIVLNGGVRNPLDGSSYDYGYKKYYR
ncbi:MAG: CpsD/CapB family tyrosine-protein kinase [Acidobacteria bacterium]|nr:CpsD/CapB family tyrosine-protein kinase [Acidobacteriota bacterium]